MFSNEVFKATNTEILSQTYHQPAPNAVLLATLEAVGGQPEVVGVIVDWGNEETTWDVYACRGDVFAHVHGYAKMPKWAGSNADANEVPQRVDVKARRISDLRFIAAEGVTAEAVWDGFSREGCAKWILSFDDGTVELDENSTAGHRLEPVARYVRDRFSGAGSRAS